MPSVPPAKPTLSPPMFLTAGLDTITFGTDFTSTPSVDVFPACCAVATCEGAESGPDYGLHPTNTDRTRRRRRSPKLRMRCHRSATYES